MTAYTSSFWRNLRFNLTRADTSPSGHLTVIKLLIQQFKLFEGEVTEIVSDNLGQLLKGKTYFENCFRIFFPEFTFIFQPGDYVMNLFKKIHVEVVLKSGGL